VPESSRPKVAVVMPALNAATTIRPMVEAIPRDLVDEVIVVDDGSTDETLAIARDLDVFVVWHPHTVGYGGNQKTCYLHALQRDAGVVVMLHPDGQYEPSLIPELIGPILAGKADLVLGSRMAEPGAARRGGMPLYKIAANRFLTGIENRVMHTSLTDLHTGYRAYSRELLLQVPFLRNALDFSFDSEMLLQAAHFGFKITDVPARTRYFRDASSITLAPASVYGLKTLWAAARLVLHRRGIIRARKFAESKPPPRGGASTGAGVDPGGL
jgi:glycosyltransferase involved in cell wall biosynthesis